MFLFIPLNMKQFNLQNLLTHWEILKRVFVKNIKPKMFPLKNIQQLLLAIAYNNGSPWVITSIKAI